MTLSKQQHTTLSKPLAVFFSLKNEFTARTFVENCLYIKFLFLLSLFPLGEGSPSNLHLNTHWMHLPGNEHLSEPRVVILDYIKHFLPNAKIIVLFRDPIER